MYTDFGRQVVAWTKEDHRRLTYVWDLGDGITKTKRPGGLAWEAPKLYDHDSDPGEDVNPANHTEYKSVVDDLKRKLKAGWKKAQPNNGP